MDRPGLLDKLGKDIRSTKYICPDNLKAAHDHNGTRIETVELSLAEGRVIQSRGVCNNTEYHDRIIELVNANAHRFIEAKESA